MVRAIYFWAIVVCFSWNIDESYLCTPETVHCYENIPKRQFPDRPIDCKPPDPRVRNESCFVCDNECTTIQEINAMKKRGEKRFECERNRPTVKISCCLQAQMLNEQRSTGGKYKCYGANKSADPQMDCPFGRGGSHCQDEFTEQVKCLCLRSPGLEHLLNHLIDCHEEHKPESWTECRLVVGDFLCSCNKTKEMEHVANTEYCSAPDPKPDKVTSGSQGQFSGNVYMVALVVLMTNIYQLFDVYEYLKQEA